MGVKDAVQRGEEMNEQIKTLRDLATKEMYGENIYNGAPEFMGYELDESKFAELIIRKCASIYIIMDHGNLHMGTDDYLEALHRTFFNDVG